MTYSARSPSRLERLETSARTKFHGSQRTFCINSSPAPAKGDALVHYTCKLALSLRKGLLRDIRRLWALPQMSDTEIPLQDFRLRPLESTGLCAGSRQAGGGDRDDLGKTTSDPGRRGSQHCGYLSHLTSSIGAGGTVVPTTAVLWKMVSHGLTSRDVYENSNARLVVFSYWQWVYCRDLTLRRTKFLRGFGPMTTHLISWLPVSCLYRTKPFLPRDPDRSRSPRSIARWSCRSRSHAIQKGPQAANVSRVS